MAIKRIENVLEGTGVVREEPPRFDYDPPYLDVSDPEVRRKFIAKDRTPTDFSILARMYRR